MRVLVTGGAGYIGSHTLIHLLRARHEVVVLDNFSSGHMEALRRVRRLSNSGFSVVKGDIQDSLLLEKMFLEYEPEAVIHFAGLKSVNESVSSPVDYYLNNVGGSLELLRAMRNSQCRKIVFSSSANVYGAPKYLPFDEVHPVAPTNPYGRSKLFVEEMIKDWVAASANSSAVILRYFNPVGADESGLIGESTKGTPNNLVPYIAKVASGRSDYVRVYGDDYGTRDGTGERDYIHVDDLANAHLAAIELTSRKFGFDVVNIGTGEGTTVLEMIRHFEEASGREVPYKVVPRREGDVSRSIASVEKAARLLRWRSKLGVAEMCKSMWNWQKENPGGYGEPEEDGK